MGRVVLPPKVVVVPEKEPNVGFQVLGRLIQGCCYT